jgi:hypothetical protein
VKRCKGLTDRAALLLCRSAAQEIGYLMYILSKRGEGRAQHREAFERIDALARKLRYHGRLAKRLEPAEQLADRFSRAEAAS